MAHRLSLAIFTFAGIAIAKQFKSNHVLRVPSSGAFPFLGPVESHKAHQRGDAEMSIEFARGAAGELAEAGRIESDL